MRIQYQIKSEKVNQSKEISSPYITTDAELILSIGSTIKDKEGMSAKIDFEAGIPCEFNNIEKAYSALRSMVAVNFYAGILSGYSGKEFDQEIELELPEMKHTDSMSQSIAIAKGFNFQLADYEFFRYYIKARKWGYDKKSKAFLTNFINSKAEEEKTKLKNIKENNGDFNEWVFDNLDEPDFFKKNKVNILSKVKTQSQPSDPGEFMITFGKYGKHSHTSIRDISKDYGLSELLGYMKWLKKLETPSMKVIDAIKAMNNFVILPENEKFLEENYGISAEDFKEEDPF